MKSSALLATGIGLLLTLAFIGCQNSPTAQASVKPEASLLQIAQSFRTWTKANDEPYEVAYNVSALCIGASPEMVALQKSDPHRSRFITVYVNPIGKDALLQGKTFPVGSVLVKEKHVGKNGRVELYTIMRKRESGYNPTCGDWEFAVANADMSAIPEQGKLASCMRCHQRVEPKSDFVFASYTPAKKNHPTFLAPWFSTQFKESDTIRFSATSPRRP